MTAGNYPGHGIRLCNEGFQTPCSSLLAGEGRMGKGVCVAAVWCVSLQPGWALFTKPASLLVLWLFDPATPSSLESTSPLCSATVLSQFLFLFLILICTKQISSSHLWPVWTVDTVLLYHTDWLNWLSFISMTTGSGSLLSLPRRSLGKQGFISVFVLNSTVAWIAVGRSHVWRACSSLSLTAVHCDFISHRNVLTFRLGAKLC